ncbi:MAG TPA: type II toxin-antitoxin system VapC family toxin [Steroidobacteraceae bacterium]|nr:type II toxin-antitoxin system VapC family toxin [Steroidobacteraceae bacterium]
MRLLLDTQIFLWWLADSRKLGKPARELIESADEVYVSAASIVECELKIEAGLLDADPQELVRGIAASGFRELPVRARPAAAAASLKRADGADGFDRLLVSQAMAEPLRFLTANGALKQYSELVEVPSTAN